MPNVNTPRIGYCFDCLSYWAMKPSGETAKLYFPPWLFGSQQAHETLQRLVNWAYGGSLNA